jgi:indolepyruvate ferredoxin oxidoreductase alpha subunit
MMEPAGPAEGFAMMREAFAASERLRMPVIVRITRSFTQQVEAVEVPDGPHEQPDLGLAGEPWRFVPVPRNVVAKHRELHARLEQAGRWVEELPFNQETGVGDRGIVGVGFAHRKLLEAIGERPVEGLRVLKLAAHYPVPAGLVARFLNGCREVLVIEETEPFVEARLKAIAHDLGCRVTIRGKDSNDLPREGELFRWQIQRALQRFLPDFLPSRIFAEADEAAERPRRESHCAGCRYAEILDSLHSAAAEIGESPVLVGDPGCLVTVADRLHAKYAIGSAVGVADGLRRAGLGRRAVALFGDSSFFHTTLPAICNAVVGRSDILMIVLDNGATVTSGFQPNPGVGRDALGRPAPALSIERIAAACGVEYVQGIGPDAPADDLRAAFRAALAHRGLALLVVRTRCDRHP